MKHLLDDGTGVRGYTGPQVGALLGDATVSTQPKHPDKIYSRSVDSTSLHLSLRVDDDTGVVLEVEEHTVPSSPRLSLTADDSGHDWGSAHDAKKSADRPTLLPQLRLSLLDGSHDHVAGGGSGKPVKTSSETNDGDNVEV